MPCRALEAFRRTGSRCPPDPHSDVLMPCRALEAFRPAIATAVRGRGRPYVLMPCRALEAFRLNRLDQADPGWSDVLMPCRALEAFRHRQHRSAVVG